MTVAAPPAPGRGRVGYVLRSYPRLSQTFVLEEILGLERLGLDLAVFALTDPREPLVQERVGDVRAPVRYVPAGRRPVAVVAGEHLEVARTAPARYLATVLHVLRHRESDAGYRSSSRFACFLAAVALARTLRDDGRHGGVPVRHLHAHFAHDPALVALLVHRLTGISFSFTAHARDLYQVDPAALATRLEAAEAVVTCCRPNIDHLVRAAPGAVAKVRLVHHGVDPDEFRPGPGGRPGLVPLIVSVGRLVEKKGFPDLVEACARLARSGRAFRCVIHGDGPLRGDLEAMIERLGLAGRVELAGPATRARLLPALQQAQVFALTPFVTADGDADGIPNVLVEAMACGLPVVTTAVGGIPDLVAHGTHGLVAAPRDLEAITRHLAALLDDPALGEQLGRAGRRTVVERFDARDGARRLAELFVAALDRDEGARC